jgi:hypothetical protein
MMTLLDLPRVDGDIGDRERLIGLRISKKIEYFQKLKPTVLPSPQFCPALEPFHNVTVQHGT